MLLVTNFGSTLYFILKIQLSVCVTSLLFFFLVQCNLSCGVRGLQGQVHYNCWRPGDPEDKGELQDHQVSLVNENLLLLLGRPRVRGYSTNFLLFLRGGRPNDEVVYLWEYLDIPSVVHHNDVIVVAAWVVMDIRGLSSTVSTSIVNTLNQLGSLELIVTILLGVTSRWHLLSTLRVL